MAKRSRQSPLVRLMNSDDAEETYVTTLEDCQKWFNILNEEIFRGKLSPLDDIKIGQRKKCYAFYQMTYDTENPDFLVAELYMHTKYKSKQFFISVLLHEMCHHYQAIYGLPLGHGPSFMEWKKEANKKGINLVKAYYE